MVLKWKQTGEHFNSLMGRVVPTMESYRELTPEEAAHIAEVEARSGYRAPPPELEPTGRIGDDDRWDALWVWFQENTDDGHDAFLVHICKRNPGHSLPEVYCGTDSWCKDKLGLRGYN